MLGGRVRMYGGGELLAGKARRGRHGLRWKYNIKVNLKVIGKEGVECTDLA